MFKFKNLHIGYSNKNRDVILFTVDEIDFQRGEFVALIGPNGAGKTSLFNTLLGLHKPLKGSICLADTPFVNLNAKEKVEAISFVPSKFVGIEHLSVYDLVAMGRAPYTNVLNQLAPSDHALVAATIQQLGLTEFQDKSTVSLSDGERQIAMIGKALTQEAKIMVLDEPTAFLDFNNRRKILRLLRELAEKNKQLIFISSHDLALCFEFCNRIIAIDKERKVLLDFQPPFEEEKIIEAIFGQLER